MVERRIPNPFVVGSSPSSPATISKNFTWWLSLLKVKYAKRRFNLAADDLCLMGLSCRFRFLENVHVYWAKVRLA